MKKHHLSHRNPLAKRIGIHVFFPVISLAIGASVGAHMMGCPSKDGNNNGVSVTAPVKNGAPSESLPKKAPLSEHAATAPKEEKLAVEIALFMKIQDEAKAILDSLDSEKRKAEALKERLILVEKELSQEIVLDALTATRDKVDQKIQVPSSSLLYRASVLGAHMKSMLSNSRKPSDGGSPTIREMESERMVQRSRVFKLAAAIEVARKALVRVEELKTALPRLEALAIEKKSPPAPTKKK